jgi:hypothetical protein
VAITFVVAGGATTVVPKPRALLGRIRDVLRPDESLLERAVAGGLWMRLLTVVNRVVHVGTLLILASVLAPVDFGLLGLGLLVLTVVRRGLRLGLDAVLVQLEAPVEADAAPRRSGRGSRARRRRGSPVDQAARGAPSSPRKRETIDTDYRAAREISSSYRAETRRRRLGQSSGVSHPNS